MRWKVFIATVGTIVTLLGAMVALAMDVGEFCTKYVGEPICRPEGEPDATLALIDRLDAALERHAADVSRWEEVGVATDDDHERLHQAKDHLNNATQAVVAEEFSRARAELEDGHEQLGGIEGRAEKEAVVRSHEFVEHALVDLDAHVTWAEDILAAWSFIGSATDQDRAILDAASRGALDARASFDGRDYVAAEEHVEAAEEQLDGIRQQSAKVAEADAYMDAKDGLPSLSKRIKLAESVVEERELDGEDVSAIRNHLQSARRLHGEARSAFEDGQYAHSNTLVRAADEHLDTVLEPDQVNTPGPGALGAAGAALAAAWVARRKTAW